MQYDLEQVRTHLELMTGEKDPIVSWQIYYDPSGIVPPTGCTKDFHGRLSDNLDYFKQMQQRHCGVYISVNKTDGKGRKKDNIVTRKFFVADWDGVLPPPLKLKPTFTCRRDATHVHAYWAIDGDVSNEEWKLIQKKISIYYNSDKQINNPAQVLRVCGFLHQKNPSDPQMYRISETNVGASYTAAQMSESLVLSPVLQKAYDDWCENKKAIKEGIGYERNEREEKHYINWLSKIAPPAIIGDGSNQLVRTCLYGKDRGIFLEINQELMWKHYNPRCEPPWDVNLQSDKDYFFNTIANAYEHSTSAAGCKTARAKFSARPPLPERIDGWVEKEKEKPKKIELSKEFVLRKISPKPKGDNPEFGRISREKAELMISNLTDKSPEYDLAVCFDGMMFDGRECYRCDKVYYVYNGKTWDEVGDDVVKAMIQKLYSNMKPANGKVYGILQSHCDLVNKPNLKNSMWLDNDSRDPKNISVFNNGIVDLSQDVLKLEPHTYKYFSFNKKDYDYDPEAKCPTWKLFLSQVFEHDMDCAKVLMEFIGLCLTSDLKFQKFLFLLGVSRGGKGVVTNIIRNVIGKDNCCNPPLSNIHKDHVLFTLHDKAVGFLDDVRSVPINIRETVLSSMLQITGGDPQTFDIKFKPPQTAVIPARLIMTANVPPDFIDASGALMNRTILVKFVKSFRGKENKDLLVNLLKELSGISMMAIRHYREMLKTGNFTEPKSSIDEKQEIRDEMFPLSGFVNTCCELSPLSMTSTDDLYKAYSLYCNMDGVKMPYTKIKFVKQLKNSDLMLSMSRKTVNGVKSNYFTGIGIRPDIKDTMNIDNIRKFQNRTK